MKDYSEIQCPVCGGKIYVQPKLLLQGSSFNCSTQNCDASVSLSSSSYNVTQHAMTEFERVKQTALNESM